MNGWKVRGKTNKYVQLDYYMYSEELGEGKFLDVYQEHIKSIVTKEMYSSVEYRVETN